MHVCAHAFAHALYELFVRRGGVLLEYWRGHEERITLALPSGAGGAPLHELHSATCVEHVAVWLCVCV